jgi:serine/threonine protein kinase
MTPEEWHRVRPILESALELDSANRRAFLNEGCADPSLRREVESLIDAHEQADTWDLNSLSVLDLGVEEGARFRLLPGKRVGPYEILEELALGGMGAVYRAVRADGEYKQQVALKIVRADFGADPTAKRFRNERQILASLDHHNIAKILDGGTTADGLPYFVMEFIDGLPITDYCDRHKLTIDARLTIFRTVCSAVHHAHQHLVIHRDLKPNNILVLEDGSPKLLDFGIAKVLNPEPSNQSWLATQTGLRCMTPAYASPEQARGKSVSARPMFIR